MSEAGTKDMTVDQALARIMDLHKLSPGDDVFRPEVRKILGRLRQAGWSEGYREGRADGECE